MRKFYVLLLCSVFLKTANAQKISGKITDITTKEALIGVNIVLNNGGGTSTDINGEYQLDINEGKQDVTFKYIGYKEVTRTISLEKNQNQTYQPCYLVVHY